MTQIGNLKQRMKGLVSYTTTGLSSLSSPTSNRMDGTFPSSLSAEEINVISKPASLSGKTSDKSLALGSSKQRLNAEEIRILARVEEQNRLLEADRKSLKSVSSDVVKNSNEPLSPTSGSAHSSLSCGNESENNSLVLPDSDDKIWMMWGRIVNDWSEFKKKNGKQLKEMIRCGIPHHFRGLVWQLLCDAPNSPHQTKYTDLLRQVSPSEKLIRRDITRTYPEQDFFKDGVGQEVLFNVIKAYSLLDREVGYCQGSAFIAGLLLMQMPEEEAFTVFVSLMQDYRLRELFKPSMAELGLCMYQFENLLQEHAPDLMIHFQAQAIHTSMFASSWFLTLFATFFDLSLACRILDVFISEGMEIIFRIGLAILLSNQTKLLNLDLEGMLKHISKDLVEYYNNDPDLLFQKAYALVRYNPKKMKKLEKDYTSMKNKEQEEQVEMRRLRTENRLLRQRIEGLETENGTLADKLIQDRVNRALEAEEKIIMGKELSIAKRQAQLSQSNILNGPVSTEESPTSSNCDVKATNSRLSINEQDLVKAKMEVAETQSKILELQDKICDLEEKNRELTDQSKVAALEEELVMVKFREAEATDSMKDLTQKLQSLEDNWQKHLNRSINSRRVITTSKNSYASKVAMQELQEELLSAKLSETKFSSLYAEAKKKLLELETANRICNAQLRRSEEDKSILGEKSRVLSDNERLLRQEMNEVKARVAHMESKNQEALTSLRLREAESTMKIAELLQEISCLKAKMNEAIKVRYSTSHSAPPPQDHESTKIMHQLQGKLLRQQHQLDRLRRQVRRSGQDVDDDEDDLSSLEDSDVDELLFDITLTSDGVNLLENSEPYPLPIVGSVTNTRDSSLFESEILPNDVIDDVINQS